MDQDATFDAFAFFIPHQGVELLSYGATVELCQVRARFEALDELIFMAPPEFFGIFLQPKRSYLSIVRIHFRSIPPPGGLGYLARKAEKCAF